MWFKMCNTFYITAIIALLSPEISSLDSLNCDNKLIVVLADGFRWDYIDSLSSDDLPGLRTMLSDGVRAKYMNPVTPTNTYPNMYSLVTGLYPENHEMVDNIMYDEPHDEWFLMHPHPNASHSFWWNDAEPFWVSTTKRGIKTAMYWWLGCEVAIRNITPTYCEPYVSMYGSEFLYENASSHIDDGLKRLSADNYDVMMLYYGDTDYVGHKYGPSSKEMIVSLKTFDEVMVYLQEKIKHYNLTDKVNVILVSDHGMTRSDKDAVTYIDLSKYVEMENIKYLLGLGSSAGITPIPGKMTNVLESLKLVDGIKVYTKEDLPIEFHMKHAARMAKIYIVAEKGYFIKKIEDPSVIHLVNMVDTEFWHGFHGYNATSMEDMRAIFFASGPEFKKNFTSSAIDNIDVYNLLCYIVGIKPNANNGTWSHIQDMLINEGNNSYCRVSDSKI